MQRSLWRGAIAFGLIYVPVESFSASEDNALPLHLLDTLRFADELLAPAQVKASDSSSISAQELAMAKQLIVEMSGTFKPERFKETYRADLKRRIREKIRNKQWHTLEVDMPAGSARPKAQVIDLMAALKASLKRLRASASRAAPARAVKDKKCA